MSNPRPGRGFTPAGAGTGESMNIINAFIQMIMLILGWIFNPGSENVIMIVILINVIFFIVTGFFHMFRLIRRYPK